MSDTGAIGIVGLGNMGSGMARNLVDNGWTVYGCDLDEHLVQDASDYGINPVATPAELADQVDIVGTSLPGPEAVKTVYLDENGLDAGADGDLIALEMSTIDPGTTETIAKSTENLTVIGSPVSGGPERAREGTLTLMLGGDRTVIEQPLVQDAIETLGENAYHLGGVGAGHTTKLLNNQIGAGVRAAVLEAAAIAAVQDVDWEAFMQVVRHSSGSSYQFRKKMPRALNRDFEPGFDIDTSEKDIRLALEMANSVGANTPVTNEVYELYKRAIGKGIGDEDTTALVKLFEDTTGVPVESDQSFDDDFLDWTKI